jgi:hypothetical protein
LDINTIETPSYLSLFPEPVIQESPAGFQVHVYEGDDALITCVVRNANNVTLMWKSLDRGDKKHSTRVLTAGETRLTADKRVDILHDKGKRQRLSSLSI